MAPLLRNQWHGHTEIPTLIRLNPEITAQPALADEVIYKLRAVLIAVNQVGLVKANEEFFKWMTGEKTMPFGENNRHVPVRLIDFENVTNNSYIVTNQFRVQLLDKRVDKVHQRIGRAKKMYPSVHYRYNITVTNDEKNKNVIDIKWSIDPFKNEEKTDNLGKYFIRTSMDMKSEVLVWNVYNTIREIEGVFRTLKTDLDLRPIYHKNDGATLAHLHLGLLAYWIVNTIRCRLKSQWITVGWKEITRIGNTQKVISTSGYNIAGKEITVRKCSEPQQKLAEIQEVLQIKSKPFTKLKSVVHKPKLKKIDSQQQRAIGPG